MKYCTLLVVVCTCLWTVGVKAQAEILHPLLDPINNLEQLIDTSGWDDDYRTSEEDGQRGTQFDYDIEHPPSDAERIGCICMDGTTMDLRGGGACGGYGGVRFWVYESKDGTTFNFPTIRHREHPSDLTEEEINSLTSRTRQVKYGDALDAISGDKHFGWEELMAVMMICVTIAFIAKTFWGNRRRHHDDILN